MAYEFKFPDVGEGIHEGEIVKWRVKAGDEVKEDQPLVEVETAKAIVEIPSPRSGTILATFGKEGEIIHVGATLTVIGDKGEKFDPSKLSKGTPQITKAPGVIGQIPMEAGVVLPPRKSETEKKSSAPVSSVQPPNRDSWGDIEYVPLKSIRKAIAEHMVKSKFTIPHVTHMDECDATALIKLRESKKAEAEKQGLKLTFLPFIIKAVAETLKTHPALNAAFDDATKQNIIYKKYFNTGIAVDTPDGLMVPVLRNVDQKNIFQIASELNELAQKCRDRTVGLEELQGGTFSITNIGSVGGIFATPIISYGQTGNLGVFRIKEKPVALNGKVEIRPILTLALSYDHRVVDGAEAARFINDLIATLEK
ncbi:2-oxo acid dehydrogenase subunit E2 [Candidatus Peregrinibacteria bacterium]|nr:2-oxo acid dehydrogenase subunit E2 [Candidatus Peregrinibacteria bacterium]